MPIPFREAEHIFSAPKVLLKPMAWSDVANGHRQVCLTAPVALNEGAVPRGVLFRCYAYPAHLSVFTFQLDCERYEMRRRIELYRLEVCPFRPHTNKCYGPDEINGRYFAPEETHEHDFHDSLTEAGDLRVNSCEQARPIERPPTDFATACDVFCRRINIVNGDEIPPPPAQGQLF